MKEMSDTILAMTQTDIIAMIVTLYFFVMAVSFFIFVGLFIEIARIHKRLEAIETKPRAVAASRPKASML